MGDLAILNRLDGDIPDWFDPDSIARLKRNLAGPGPREHWKHSSLAKTLDALASTAPSDNTLDRILPQGLPLGVEALRFSETDPPTREAIRQQLSHRMDWSRYPLADVVGLLAGDGWLLRLRQSLDTPLSIDFPSGISPPVIVQVDPGVVVEILETSKAVGVQAGLINILIGDDARVIHARQNLVSDVQHWQLLRATLGVNATYSLYNHVVGAQQRRIDCQILLEGDRSTAELMGAGITDDGTHLDQQHVVEHIGRQTTSRNKLHNIAQGKSRCTFNGRIHIHDNATGTDADLQNKNLAMHTSSEINTKPELEIYNDDVKCSHGATVGQLDDDAVFYLRSRGIEPSIARRLLCTGFITECIDGPFADGLRAEFVGRLGS